MASVKDAAKVVSVGMNRVSETEVRRSNSKGSKNLAPIADDKDNERIVKSVIAKRMLNKAEKLDLNTCTPAQVEKRVAEYMAVCTEYNVKPTFAGLTLAFGLSKSTFMRHATGEVQSMPGVMEELETAIAMINDILETAMSEGKTPTVSGIFLLKNNFGYKDQSEVTVKPSPALGTGKSQKSLESEYLDSVVIDPPALPEAEKGAKQKNKKGRP